MVIPKELFLWHIIRQRLVTAIVVSWLQSGDHLYQETSASSASTPISNSHLPRKRFFVHLLLVRKQKINQSIFNLEKSQGRSLVECPTCHVLPRSDPSALRWKCAGILWVFYQSGSIFQTLISSKHKVIKYFWLMKRSKGRHWEVSKSRVMKFQRIHNQAHQIKNGNTFNITKKGRKPFPKLKLPDVHGPKDQH